MDVETNDGWERLADRSNTGGIQFVLKLSH